MAASRTHLELPLLPAAAPAIVDALPPGPRRILLFGATGIGKSTLLAALVRTLAARRQGCWALNADPGSPAFGLPGSVCLARWTGEDWQLRDSAALCTLDAGRFRLPLVEAVRSLRSPPPGETLLVDTPGVVRGIAGRELLPALAHATDADTVLALAPPGTAPPLLDELHALSATVYQVEACTAARRPGKRARARQRTAQWDAYLQAPVEQQYALAQIHLAGTPPPVAEPHAWIGRQIGLLQCGRSLALGQVEGLHEGRLRLSLPFEVRRADTLLIRDAARGTDGLLETAAPYAPQPYAYLPPGDVIPAVAMDTGSRVVTRVGHVDAGLINGVFGDPLLHLRMRHQRRSLLFDLGDGSRLPARVAHQVSDIFISHCHLDHIGGFLWLLRSRFGDYPACRLYGPPGLARHIGGFLQGILWDRIADEGPVFEVTELHPGRVRRFRLQAGRDGQVYLGEDEVHAGVLLREDGFCVRSAVLDHRGTPVMAYAFEPQAQINVRKDRLRAHALAPGPWLNELKTQLLQGERDARVQLPNGRSARAGELAEDLVIITPGRKLVYATDLADSPDNRRRLIALAHQAHTLFCEAAFMEQDRDHAARHGHLTARACGEIAARANVSRLVPFHFSRRYGDSEQAVYAEIRDYFADVLMPQGAPQAP